MAGLGQDWVWTEPCQSQVPEIQTEFSSYVAGIQETKASPLHPRTPLDEDETNNLSQVLNLGAAMKDVGALTTGINAHYQSYFLRVV